MEKRVLIVENENEISLHYDEHLECGCVNDFWVTFTKEEIVGLIRYVETHNKELWSTHQCENHYREGLKKIEVKNNTLSMI